MKYKLNQPKNIGVNYSESPYKFAERNVRGLALLITAQEKRDTECVDTDILRTSPWLYNKDHTEEYNDEENVIDDESHEENVNEKKVILLRKMLKARKILQNSRRKKILQKM